MWDVEETLHDDLLIGERRLPACSLRQLAANMFSSHACKDTERPASCRTQRLAACAPQNSRSPLAPMTLPERVKADYETMNLTTGPHPMKLLRGNLPHIWRAIDLVKARHGSTIQIAGNVICRQRPGTAKGFVFISLEDETGVSNAIVEPELFERFRLPITEEAFSPDRRRSAKLRQRRFDQNAQYQTARARAAHRKRVARFQVGTSRCAIRVGAARRPFALLPRVMGLGRLWLGRFLRLVFPRPRPSRCETSPGLSIRS